MRSQYTTNLKIFLFHYYCILLIFIVFIYFIYQCVLIQQEIIQNVNGCQEKEVFSLQTWNGTDTTVPSTIQTSPPEGMAAKIEQRRGGHRQTSQRTSISY